MNKIIYILLVALLVLPISYAITGKIGNGKVVLYPTVNNGEITEIERYIRVISNNNQSIKINLETADEFIEIIDKEFILNENEEKNARFVLKLRYSGDYEGNVVVKFTPIEGKGPGIALPASITIHADGSAEKFVNSENNQNGENNNIGVESDTSGEVVKDIKENSVNPLIILAIILGVIIIASGLMFLILRRS